MYISASTINVVGKRKIQFNKNVRHNPMTDILIVFSKENHHQYQIMYTYM